MGQEQQKVLEMVASGKITPEEGVRLLNALTSSTQPKKRPLVDLPEIRVPRIDLGPFAEYGVELRNTVVGGAASAKKAFKDSKAGHYLEVRKFDVGGPEVAGIIKASLELECSAGKLTLVSGDTGGKLVTGSVVRVNQEPTVSSEVAGDSAKFELSHSLGRAALVISPLPEYDVRLQNAASDSRLDLSDVKVNSLSIENNAGSVAARIGGEQWKLQVNIQNNAGSVRLAVPTSHALRIVGSTSLSGSNLDIFGFQTVAGGSQSGDWETNEKRCEIVLVQNVASFELVWRKQKIDGVVEVMKQETVGTPESNGSIPTSEL
ncbi:MAG: hypothetical protein M3R04_01225 [bacterium]|nr:hypothetical protein [bacterium]